MWRADVGRIKDRKTFRLNYNLFKSTVMGQSLHTEWPQKTNTLEKFRVPQLIMCGDRNKCEIHKIGKINNAATFYI